MPVLAEVHRRSDEFKTVVQKKAETLRQGKIIRGVFDRFRFPRVESTPSSIETAPQPVYEVTLKQDAKGRWHDRLGRFVSNKFVSEWHAKTHEKLPAQETLEKSATIVELPKKPQRKWVTPSRLVGAAAVAAITLGALWAETQPTQASNASAPELKPIELSQGTVFDPRLFQPKKKFVQISEQDAERMVDEFSKAWEEGQPIPEGRTLRDDIDDQFRDLGTDQQKIIEDEVLEMQKDAVDADTGQKFDLEELTGVQSLQMKFYPQDQKRLERDITHPKNS